MAPKIDRFWEGYIKCLSDEGYTFSNIIKRCKSKNFDISKFAIHKILKRNQNGVGNISQNITRNSNNNKTKVRTKQNINKIAKIINVENVPTQFHMAKLLKTTPTTVGKIIHHDLGLKTKFKRKVHRLTLKHQQERKTNARKLYENHLSGEKWKYVVTIDESWVYLSDCNQKRKIYYSKPGKNNIGKWPLEAKESFSKGFMVVAGFCYNGKLEIRKIPSNTKVNSEYYQSHVLGPIWHNEIPKLYGSEVNKVWFHQDKASSHTSHSTALFLHNLSMQTGINAIPFSSIPVKSPDAAPMDFACFGLLKRALRKRRATTLDGLWKVVMDEWNKLDLTILRRSLLSWKIRCRAIAKNQGKQIEHIKHYKYGLALN
jgi:hypothetical protein